jgi:putative Mn2+ efflux pump MntP
MSLSWWEILGIAFGLAMDAFAVSIAAGITLEKLTGRHVFRLGWHFGLFQFLMPVIGWLAGRTVASYISGLSHWVAFGLLGYVGGKMLYEAFQAEEHRSGRDPTKGLLMVTLSVATSIDALAVGLSMAVMSITIWVPALIIGLVAGTLTTLGILFGSRVGSRWGRRAEVLGGLVLIGIGTRILLTALIG